MTLEKSEERPLKAPDIDLGELDPTLAPECAWETRDTLDQL